MKTRYFIPLIFLLFTIKTNAQWVQMSTGTIEDIFSVDYATSNEIYMGSEDRMIYSVNGGNTWNTILPLVDNNGLVIPGNIYDIKSLGNGTLLGAGLFIFNNTEQILRSVNNGASWNLILNPASSSALIRQSNSLAGRNNIMVMGGDNGWLARSTNSGANWTFYNSGVSNHVLDVEFITNDTVLAVGTNRIWRSTNGGVSWLSWLLPGSHATISTSQNFVYIGNESSNFIQKSSDAGSSFASINIPFYCNGVIYAISDDTLLAAADSAMYISFSGGSTWSKLILPVYAEVSMIDYNQGNVIAVGRQGYAIRNGNIGSAPVLPVTGFTIGGNFPYCQGDQILLNNSTGIIPGHSYQWAYDGQVISNQYNTSITLNQAGTHTISLAVSNQFGTVTTSKSIVVIGHIVPHFLFKSDYDTVCSGSFATFTVPHSQSGVIYQLRNGFSSVGLPKAGNGSALTFVTASPLNSSASFNLIATSSNLCFTDSLVRSDSVFILPSPLKPFCGPTGNPNAGISRFSFHTINNITAAGATVYNDYSCQIKTTIIAGNTYQVILNASNSGQFGIWIDMDSSGNFTPNETVMTSAAGISNYTGTVAIPILLQCYNVTVRMRVGYEPAGNLLSPCGSSTGEYEDYTVTIIHSPVVPVPAFSTVITTSCSTTVAFNNLTANANSYLWDFGDGSTSTLEHPVHSYSSSGNYNVSLTASNPTGSAVTTQNFSTTLLNLPVPTACDPIMSSSCNSSLAEVKLLSLTKPNIPSTPSPHVLSEDFTCNKRFNLVRDSSYVIWYSVADNSSCGNSCIWIDFNADGDFTDPSERLYSGLFGHCPATMSFTIPSNAVLNTPLRLRIIGSMTLFSNECDNICGQYEDYTIIIDSLPNPDPEFTVSQNTACMNSQVQFTNTTLNGYSNLWDFGDGTTSSVFSPVHTYQSPGYYNVTLKVCDSLGICDSLTKYNYINVQPNQYSIQKLICPGQTVTFGSNTYSTTGVYTDTLNSILGCDSIILMHLFVSNHNSLIITPHGPTGFCKGDSVKLTAPTALSGWQWYYNDVAINGAIASEYIAKNQGNYYCIAYDSSLCTVTSNSIKVKIPCDIIFPPPLKPLKRESLAIDPNPSIGVFTLKSEIGEMTVINSWGKIVYKDLLTSSTNRLDLTSMTSGIYTVVVKSANGLATAKLMLLNID